MRRGKTKEHKPVTGNTLAELLESASKRHTDLVPGTFYYSAEIKGTEIHLKDQETFELVMDKAVGEKVTLIAKLIEVKPLPPSEEESKLPEGTKEAAAIGISLKFYNEIGTSIPNREILGKLNKLPAFDWSKLPEIEESEDEDGLKKVVVRVKKDVFKDANNDLYEGEIDETGRKHGVGTRLSRIAG